MLVVMQFYPTLNYIRNKIELKLTILVVKHKISSSFVNKFYLNQGYTKGGGELYNYFHDLCNDTINCI